MPATNEVDSRKSGGEVELDQVVLVDGVNKDSGFVVGGVNTEESIRKLTHINGVEITELERRMRPTYRASTLPSMTSYDGFLGEDESLVEVLVRANNIVAEAGYTHEQVAEWMRVAISQYKGNEKTGGDVVFKVNGMDFVVSKISTLCDVDSTQLSPFRNLILLDDDENINWGGEYLIKNVSTGRSIVLTEQVPEWITKWGFYEGFDTPYHVSPQGAIDIFTREDRVFETVEEWGERMRSEKMTEGWQVVGYGRTVDGLEHEGFCEVLDLARKELGMGDHLSMGDLMEVLQDDSFLVVHFLKDKLSHKLSSGLVVWDRKTEKVIYKDKERLSCDDVSREVLGGGVAVTVRAVEEGGGGMEHVLKLYDGVDSGWKRYTAGSDYDIGGMTQLFLYPGTPKVEGDDYYWKYENDMVEMILHDKNTRGSIWYAYIHEKLSSTRRIVTFSKKFLRDQLKRDIGDEEYVVGVEDVRYEDALIRARLVLASGMEAEIKFDLG